MKNRVLRLEDEVLVVELSLSQALQRQVFMSE
jgi:hypothetical protein